MANVNPLLLVGAVIGVVTALLVLAYALVKDKKETMDFERTMNDGEILRRLAGYAKPYWAKFVVVLFLMLFSIAYDIISPLIIGALEELVSGEFELPPLSAWFPHPWAAAEGHGGRRGRRPLQRGHSHLHFTQYPCIITPAQLSLRGSFI